MGNIFYLTSILGSLLVLVYLSPLGSYDQIVFGSVSNVDDDTAAEQPIQQPLSSNGTSGAAKHVYEMHEFNVGDDTENLFILIPNEGHHGPEKGMKQDI